MSSEPFLLCDQSITPERLLALGFHENNSQQFAKMTVWSRTVHRGPITGSKSDKTSWMHVECLSSGEWKCFVESLSLNVRNMQDVADIIAVLEK